MKIFQEQSEGESRLEYLLTVAVAYIYDNPESTIFYDDAECDGYCLAEELENELNSLTAKKPTTGRGEENGK